MKLSVSVPDDLWEAAQLAVLIQDPEQAQPATSLVVQRGLQSMVAAAWRADPDLMQAWLEGKQERIKAGITKLVKGSRPARKRQSPRPLSVSERT